MAIVAFFMLVGTPFAVLAQESTPQASPGSLSGVQPLPLTSARAAELETYIEEMLAETHVPGAAVAVVQKGEIVFLEGFGVRELGRSEPVTPETMMMIGSVTKSMTALMAATLVDSGELTWETPVADLLPGFAVADPELTQQLNVRNAFCACTGVPQRDGDFIFNSDAYTPQMLIASVADFPLTAPLGELFQYSNQMFAIGGYAATAAAGGNPDDLYDAYAATMRRQVLDPMGIAASTFSLDDVRASGNSAMAHGQDLSGAYQVMNLDDEDSFVRSVAPAGALWSSAAEMARYLQIELARGVAPDGVRVVSEENLEATWAQQVALPESQYGPEELATMAHGYGLGWVLGDYRGQPLIWHNGGTFGFSSHLAFLPEADLGIVVLTNGASADILTLAIQFRLFELLFDQPRSFDELATMEIEATAEGFAARQALLGAVDVAAIRPYMGVYQNDALGEVTISQQGDMVLFDAGELQSALTPLLGEEGEVVAYMLADPPFGGAAVTLETDAGSPLMTLTDSMSGETFVFSSSGATIPEATPAT